MASFFGEILFNRCLILLNAGGCRCSNHAVGLGVSGVSTYCVFKVCACVVEIVLSKDCLVSCLLLCVIFFVCLFVCFEGTTTKKHS